MKPASIQLSDDTRQFSDPAGLSDREAANLEALADARIEILSTWHFVQKQRQLVSPGRRLSHTWLYAPLRGRIEMQICGRKRIVTPKDLVLVPAGKPHEAVLLTKNFSVVSIHLRICLPRAVHDQPIFRNTVFRIPDPASWHRQLNTMVSLERGRGHTQVSVMILRAILMSLAMRGEPLAPRRSAADPRIAQAMEMIQARLATPGGLQQIRKQVGLGAGRFRQLFREATGMTPRAYCKGLRMETALTLLRDPANTVKEIAASLGYYDTQHLEKEFKAVFGETPGSFRQKL